MVKAAILGYGTVGSGVAEVLSCNQELIAKRAGNPIEVKYILDLRNFPGDPNETKVVHDIEVILQDPEISIVCETMGGANTLSAFSTDGKLRYLGEWATGNWPRHLLQIPGTDLIVNACNKEGTLVIFAWNGKELIRKDEIILPGASCAVYLSGK